MNGYIRKLIKDNCIKDNDLYNIFKNIIDDPNITSNQFIYMLTVVLKNNRIKTFIRYTRFDRDDNILIRLINNSQFNDKFVILCTTVIESGLLNNNDADKYGWGLFENGILKGLNLDSLNYIPCSKITNPNILNKWLLKSYIAGHNNVLKYMVHNKIPIEKPHIILRLMICHFRNIEDLNMIVKYNYTRIDEFCNTPLLVAKYVGNEPAYNLILSQYDDIDYNRNMRGATCYNIKPLKYMKPAEFTGYNFEYVLTYYELMVKNIEPHTNILYQIIKFILQLLVIVVILYLYSEIIFIF